MVEYAWFSIPAFYARVRKWRKEQQIQTDEIIYECKKKKLSQMEKDWLK